MNLENPAKLYATQHFCSMKITQAVREYAAQKEIDEQAGLGVGMKEKARVHVSQSRIKQSTLSGGYRSSRRSISLARS